MNDFTLGQHEAKIDVLVSDMAEVKLSVARIEETLAERKGERKVAGWFGTTLSGAIGAAVAFFAQWVMRRHG